MNQVAILWVEPITEVLQDEAEATGDGEVLVLDGKYASLSLQTLGTFTATVKFEGSMDGENYHELKGINLNTGAGLSETTSTGVYSVPVVGIKRFRARISAYTDGEVTVLASAQAIPVPVVPGP